MRMGGKYLTKNQSFQIIFTSDGTIGVNIEHSVAEGLVLAALRNATLKKMEVEEKQVEFDLANMDASAWEWRFKRLEFPNAGKKHIREAVRSAAEDFERHEQSMSFGVLHVHAQQRTEKRK